MTWWSLTCNIARKWRLMMTEERAELAARWVLPRKASAPQQNPASSTSPRLSEFARQLVTLSVSQLLPSVTESPHRFAAHAGGAKLLGF